MTQPEVRVKGGKAWYINGMSIQKCVCKRDGRVIAGMDWLKDIIATGKPEPIMVIEQPTFDAYRRDADEDWQPPRA